MQFAFHQNLNDMSTRTNRTSQFAAVRESPLSHTLHERSDGNIPKTAQLCPFEKETETLFTSICSFPALELINQLSKHIASNCRLCSDVHY